MGDHIVNFFQTYGTARVMSITLLNETIFFLNVVAMIGLRFFFVVFAHFVYNRSCHIENNICNMAS